MSSGTFNTASDGSDGGRAFKPGPRWKFGAAAVLAAGAAAVLVLAMSGGFSSAAAGQSYGGLPKWLPKIKSTKPVLEVATPAKPVLGEEQGYTIHAQLSGGAIADVTALGPEFPGYVTNYAQEGRWPATRLVPSTFLVTYADVHGGSIPIRAADFTIITDTGEIVKAKLAARGPGKVPAVVKSGQSVTFKVITRTLEGQGAIRWAPNGNNILSSWIYQVELD